MGQTTRKQDLLDALEKSRAGWEALLAGIDPARLTEPGVVGEWSVKDIAAHLNAWEERPMHWIEAIRNETKPPRPPWAPNLSEDETNAAIYEMNRNRSLDEVLNQARETRRRVIEGLQALSEADVAERRFDWLGDNTLADSLAGNSFEHYDDHAETIRAWLKRTPVAGAS